MSLLIKALQKAEQNKAVDDKVAMSADALSLESLPDALPRFTNSEDLSLEAQAGFSGAVTKTPVKQEKQISQQAAATMFAAKAEQAPAKASKAPLLMAISLLVLLIGGAFYYYLQTLATPELVMPKASPAPLVQETTVTQPEPPAVIETAVDTTNEQAVAEGIEPVTKMPPVTTQPAPAESPAVIQADAAPAQSAVSVTKQSKRLAFGDALELGEESNVKANVKSRPVKVTRNQPADGINPNLLGAYQAFSAGDDAIAQQLYRKVLQSDVRNVDALLGMAAIAGRQGRGNDALGWYGKVLEIEPRNTVAQAAMVSVIGQADPVTSESRLKSLIAQQPQAAHLHAALGNLYAEQGQWPSAQQAYFEAYHFDAKNAEYAFNLAISLDQMGKSPLALQYYKETLALLPAEGSNIDRIQLTSRINALQQ